MGLRESNLASIALARVCFMPFCRLISRAIFLESLDLREEEEVVSEEERREVEEEGREEAAATGGSESGDCENAGADCIFFGFGDLGGAAAGPSLDLSCSIFFLFTLCCC